MITIGKRCTISAAHSLPRMPEGHQCRENHGHNYEITVELRAMTLDDTGMVLDYGIIKAIVQKYDHKCLNDLFNADEPTTAEVFALKLAGEIICGPLKALNDGTAPQEHVQLTLVEVRETPTSYARWTP